MHTLYIVATPIGNMEDITYRAVRILKEVPLVLAEDTRHTRLLFDNYGIDTPMEAYHDFNKEKVTPRYVEFLKSEGDIALVSDAGTPGVADPAFNLVRECVREGIDVRAWRLRHDYGAGLERYADGSFQLPVFFAEEEHPAHSPPRKT